MRTTMTSLTLVVAAALGAPALAQTPQSTPPSARPTSPNQQTPIQGAKVNLNTATANELSKLPRLSSGSVTAIIESRKKSPFKDWNDFTARRIVPSFSENEIKNQVRF